MNFVTEFLSFIAWLKAHPRRSLEYLGLWVYLFIQNNAAALPDESGSWHWPVWFEVDNRDLRGFMGGISSKRLWEFRQELIRYSRVEYRKASGGQAAQYALVPFDTELTPVPLCSKNDSGGPFVWKAQAESDRNREEFLSEHPPEQNRFSSDYYINNKQVNVKEYRDVGASPNQFNIPPQLTEEERKQLEDQYPDEVERFWAGMELREKKAEEEKQWAY